MSWTRFPPSGQLAPTQSPTGAALNGRPGYFVAGAADPTAAGTSPLDALEESYFGIGGPQVISNAVAVSADPPVPICEFDSNRLAVEIYCDDSSAGAVFIGGPGVQAVTGGNQAGAGIRLNPGQGRIYDGALRSIALWAICASGQTATVSVITTPRSSQ